LSILKEYENFATPHLSDNMHRLNGVGSSIFPIHTKKKLLGTAITVKTRPGDNLLVHKAISMGGDNDVIIVDAGGDLNNAIIGELMVRTAKKRGIKGFIINGAIRDSAEIKELNYPVYAKGIVHKGPYKDGPGEINVPIQIGGVLINPGNIILGDMDGIVSVPSEVSKDIVPKVKELIKKEEEMIDSIEKNNLDTTWINQRLKKKGCKDV